MVLCGSMLSKLERRAFLRFGQQVILAMGGVIFWASPWKSTEKTVPLQAQVLILGLLITLLTPAAQVPIPARRMIGVADGDRITVLDDLRVQRKIPNLIKGNLQGNQRRGPVPSSKKFAAASYTCASATFMRQARALCRFVHCKLYIACMCRSFQLA